METETAQKSQKDEAGERTEENHKHSEEIDLPKTVAKNAAPPADSRPKNPQPNREAKPPAKISEPDVKASPPPPPPPPSSPPRRE
jgi:hypothetical protein